MLWKLFAIFLFGWMLPAAASGQVVDRIIALVNDDVIFLSELEEAGKLLFEQIRKSTLPEESEGKIKKARRELLNQLIEDKLLEQEIKNRKIEVSEREVDQAIEEVMKKNQLTENDLKKALAKEGLTYSAYRQRVKLDLGKIRLINREIKAKIVVKEEDLRNYYRENIGEFTEPLEVKLQQIFLRQGPALSSKQSDELKKIALEIHQRARQGEDFGELVQRYSQGPEKAEGGVLGFFKKGELIPELEEATFHLKRGEISEVVQTPQGLHILRVLDRRGGEPRPFAEVRHRIREQITQAEGMKQFEEWLKALKSKAYIEIRLS